MNRPLPAAHDSHALRTRRPHGPTTPWTARLAILVIVALAVGCGDREGAEAGMDGQPPGAAARGPDASSEDADGMSAAELAGIDPDNVTLALDWTTSRISAESQEGETPARTLTSVDFSRVPGADRMIVGFEEDGPIPSHVVESFIRPVPRCASPDSIRSQGPGLLRIRFPDVSADSSVAMATLPDSELTNVSALHLACLRDTVVEWVLDVHDATAYRILHLSNPTRLVVDVRHADESSDTSGSDDDGSAGA